MLAADWGDVYKELGAVPVINATGSVTMLGGSTPVPEVTEAIPTPLPVIPTVGRNLKSIAASLFAPRFPPSRERRRGRDLFSKSFTHR